MSSKQKASDEYEQHERWAKNFVRTFYERDGGKAYLDELKARGRTDWDVLRENHRFLRQDDVAGADLTQVNVKPNSSNLPYEELVALKYYNQLYKEYAVIDLKHFKSGNVALRWRTEDELIDGIGQFTCGGIRCKHHKRLPSIGAESQDQPALTTYQLDFTYLEATDGASSTQLSLSELVQKQALVKVVLCPRCSKRLSWKRERDKEKQRQNERQCSTSPMEKAHESRHSHKAPQKRQGSRQPRIQRDRGRSYRTVSARSRSRSPVR
ncbi:hypothetical protein K437DRAFT_258398 [Tilletiaria anomala UBC 951]|uniref:Protein FRA10AC1 n=1 Tax=Tilletiaria anomala (strain ATCC 24038 / CBS 436.72 / UBC 951) TaxID=1037660 RepID=A0A066VHE2_TILAU|nr:uncharacterized protein K437DRAFT_258398 [Tilletiaria anomala UBC 951]KDN41157.1 hypothetical protein K437DRAFT_258398 [Tilletiaria anomala UBC 951]